MVGIDFRKYQHSIGNRKILFRSDFQTIWSILIKKREIAGFPGTNWRCYFKSGMNSTYDQQ